MRFSGGTCVFLVFVSALLPRCHSYPVPYEGADLEDGYRFREDYPDALQVTCTASVRPTTCATGPADRKPHPRPSDRSKAATWRDEDVCSGFSAERIYLVLYTSRLVVIASLLSSLLCVTLLCNDYTAVAAEDLPRIIIVICTYITTMMSLLL